MVRVAGFELLAPRLSSVKWCGSQIDATETEIFQVTLYPMFLCGVPHQRETTGKKNS